MYPRQFLQLRLDEDCKTITELTIVHVQELVMKGRTPTIDQRYKTNSFAESRLVQIIERCWIYDPDIRPSMSEVKTMLMEAIAEDGRLQNSVAGPLPT